MRLKDARALALDWHGGLWTPLYAFGSTGHVPDKKALIAEINENITLCYDVQDDVKAEKLEALRKFVEEEY